MNFKMMQIKRIMMIFICEIKKFLNKIGINYILKIFLILFYAFWTDSKSNINFKKITVIIF